MWNIKTKWLIYIPGIKAIEFIYTAIIIDGKRSRNETILAGVWGGGDFKKLRYNSCFVYHHDVHTMLLYPMPTMCLVPLLFMPSKVEIGETSSNFTLISCIHFHANLLGKIMNSYLLLPPKG